jgi:VanZ family protein
VTSAPASPLLFPPRWLRLAAGAAFAVGAVALLYGGTQPQATGLFPAPWDKLAHAVVFAGFGALAWLALGGRPPIAARFAPLAAIAVGVADEFAQSFSPGRVADPHDLLADAVGAVLAVLLLAVMRARDTRRGVHRPT